MGALIVLIAIVALWVWWKKIHYNDSEWVKNRIKGRNEDQKAVIRYFCNDPACLAMPVTVDRRRLTPFPMLLLTKTKLVETTR